MVTIRARMLAAAEWPTTVHDLPYTAGAVERRTVQGEPTRAVNLDRFGAVRCYLCTIASLLSASFELKISSMFVLF